MKLGCCLYMGSAEQIAKAGFAFTEMNLADSVSMDEVAFEKIISNANAQGVPVRSCHVLFPGTVRLTGSDVDDAVVDAYLDKAFAKAHQAGAKVLVFGSSGAKNVPEGYERTLAIGQVVNMLRRASDKMRPYGLTIAIEPLCKREANLVTTLEEGIMLCQMVERDNIRLLCDYYHFAAENDTLDTLKKAAPYLAHVHYASDSARDVPQTLDDKERAFFQTLQAANYQGDIVLEAKTTSPDVDLPRFVALMQGVL